MTQGWTISVDAISDTGVTDDEVDQLVDLFRPHSGALAVGQEGRADLGVTFSMDVDDMAEPSPPLERVAAAGAQLFREILSEIGREDWTLIRLDVCTYAAHDAVPPT